MFFQAAHTRIYRFLPNMSYKRLYRIQTIDDAISVARSRGGDCISTRYIYSTSKLKWKCHMGHIWEAAFHSVKQGRWCPHCFEMNRSKYNLEDAMNLAKNFGGWCVSSETPYIRSKLKWMCKHGHQWESTFNNVQKGHWCPTCTSMETNMSILRSAQETARHRGGQCLSKTHIPGQALLWKCSRGHVWKSHYRKVMKGTWCRYCNRQRPSIQDAHELAALREGVCLSHKVEYTKLHLLWICKNGHVFKASFNSVQQGSWCPLCRRKNQMECFDILKSLFPGVYFQHEFNMKVASRNIRLDGYSEELNLAWEYNGEQHYKFVEFFSSENR